MGTVVCGGYAATLKPLPPPGRSSLAIKRNSISVTLNFVRAVYR
jgi:hypothetical protein